MINFLYFIESLIRVTSIVITLYVAKNFICFEDKLCYLDLLKGLIILFSVVLFKFIFLSSFLFSIYLIFVPYIIANLIHLILISCAIRGYDIIANKIGWIEFLFVFYLYSLIVNSDQFLYEIFFKLYFIQKHSVQKFCMTFF